MPKVMLKNAKGLYDITDLIPTISWSGDKSQVSRVLNIGIIVSPTDQYLPRIDIQLGNVLFLYDDNGEELFRGYVWTKEKEDSSEVMTVKAYDNAIYLLKNKVVYNFKNSKPEDIAQKVCKDLGFPTGTITSTGIKFSRIFNGVSAYETIQSAYTIAHQRNGKQYYIRSMKGKLEVIEKGKNLIPFTLQTYDQSTNVGNITNSKYSETLENMVNKVLIIDEKGKVIGQVVDNDLIKMYGQMQEVFQKQEGKDPNPSAKALINGVNRTSTLTGLGITECITGNAVKVRDKYTNLVGKFFIDGDEHIWENGMYTMNLTLNFENMMEEVEAGQEGEG